MGSQGSTPQFYEDGFTEAKADKVIQYIQAGWRLKTAMSQCDISHTYRQKVIEYLEQKGVKNYRK